MTTQDQLDAFVRSMVEDYADRNGIDPKTWGTESEHMACYEDPQAEPEERGRHGNTHVR